MAMSVSTERQPSFGVTSDIKHNRAETNGVRLHYVTAGSGPIVLCLHGWPETHREYLYIIERLGHKYRFIAPDLRGFADSDKPFSGYEPKTIAADMLGLLDIEKVERFHILSHDLGGPAAVVPLRRPERSMKKLVS
jgi:pimeloyl-ACP methyl ester carboxylesterase